jgi:hypothetical protein
VVREGEGDEPVRGESQRDGGRERRGAAHMFAGRSWKNAGATSSRPGSEEPKAATNWAGCGTSGVSFVCASDVAERSARLTVQFMFCWKWIDPWGNTVPAWGDLVAQLWLARGLPWALLAPSPFLSVPEMNVAPFSWMVPNLSSPPTERSSSEALSCVEERVSRRRARRKTGRVLTLGGGGLETSKRCFRRGIISCRLSDGLTDAGKEMCNQYS